MAQKYLGLLEPVMICVKKRDDINHPPKKRPGLFLIKSFFMILSKSFGYALRGVLYVAKMQDEDRKIQIDEISGNLSVPKHFLGKIMQQIVKEGVLKSTKGPYGGFSLTDETLSTPLLRIVEITEGLEQFKVCVLKLKRCDSSTPCPLHYEMEGLRTKFLSVFSQTTIGDLLKNRKEDFIRSLAIN
jgi:Rrf2 family iron-sulfur cluster assembly transcriptional regulator